MKLVFKKDKDSQIGVFQKIDEKTYIFEAKILLNDFSKILDLQDELFDNVKGEAETLAGLILELEGEIPDKGEVIEYMGFSFKVQEVDQRRISRIKVLLPKDDNEE